jgi:putative redox protein
VEMQAQLQWIDGWQFVARAGEGPAVVIDGRKPRGGPSPMELVLMGVAGCTAIDVILVMEKKRINVTGFQVNISGERAQEHPRRYTHIQIEYVLTGTGIKPSAVERAIQLSEEKYCSAIGSLNAAFEHSYRIIDAGETGQDPAE